MDVMLRVYGYMSLGWDVWLCGRNVYGFVRNVYKVLYICKVGLGNYFIRFVIYKCVCVLIRMIYIRGFLNNIFKFTYVGIYYGVRFMFGR